MSKEQEPYTGPERRRTPLTEQQIDEIAEKAAERAVSKMTDMAYKVVGKSVLEKMCYIVGVIAVSLYFWLDARHLLK